MHNRFHTREKDYKRHSDMEEEFTRDDGHLNNFETDADHDDQDQTLDQYTRGGKTRNTMGRMNKPMLSRSNSFNSKEAMQDDISPEKRREHLTNAEQNQINQKCKSFGQ